MQTEVTIILKNPYGEDFSVVIPLSSSIADLKNKITTEHPEKPEFSRQRIIFAGRPLGDHEIISALFNADQHDLSQPQKFHLVIRRDQPTTQPPRSNVNMNEFPYPNYGNQNNMPQYPPGFMFGGYGYNNNNMNPNINQQWDGYPGNFNQFQNQYFPQPGMAAGYGVAANGRHRVGFARINIDFGLILKLLLFVYILGQGGGSDRMAILITLAICYFLYQAGVPRLRIIRMGPNGEPQPDQQQPLQQQAQQQPQQQQAQQQAQQQPQQPQQPQPQPQQPQPQQPQPQQPQPQQPQPQQQQPQQPQQENAPHEAAPPAAPVVIPMNRGIVGEVVGFIVPLFCSLLPSWQPPEMQQRQQNPQN